MNALREAAHVAVARDETVRVSQLNDVAVAIAPASLCDYRVSDRPYGRTGVGGIVGSLVLADGAENGVHPRAEHAGNAAKLERRAQEAGAKGPPVCVEILAANLGALIARGLGDRPR